MNLFCRHNTVAVITKMTCLSCLIIAGIQGSAFAQQTPQTADLPQNITPEILNDAGEEDYLILAVTAGRNLLSQGIFAIERNGKYYMPVRDLADLFKIFTNPARQDGVLTGWLNDAQNSFSLDPANNVISKKGEKTAVSPDSFVFEQNTLYADIPTLSYVWPVEMEVMLTSLTLKVNPIEDLPFQRIAKRKKLRERLGDNDNVEKKVYPFLATPYKFISKPNIHISSSLGYNGGRDRYTNSLSLSGIQDLLGTSADYSTTFRKSNGGPSSPENIRFRMTRQNIYPNALPLGLEKVQAGDVNASNRDLVGGTLSGRGIKIDNVEPGANRNFDNTTITGVSIPGYEAELYRNKALIDFTTVGEDGQYIFDDVKLFIGKNKFSVVLYGPQGQREVVNEDFFVGSNMLEPGKTEFNFSAVDSNEDLITINERPDQLGRPSGLASNLEVFHGINSKLSIFGTASHTPTRQIGEQTYTSLGAYRVRL